MNPLDILILSSPHKVLIDANTDGEFVFRLRMFEMGRAEYASVNGRDPITTETELIFRHVIAVNKDTIEMVENGITLPVDRPNPGMYYDLWVNSIQQGDHQLLDQITDEGVSFFIIACAELTMHFLELQRARRLADTVGKSLRSAGIDVAEVRVGALEDDGSVTIF